MVLDTFDITRPPIDDDFFNNDDDDNNNTVFLPCLVLNEPDPFYGKLKPFFVESKNPNEAGCFQPEGEKWLLSAKTIKLATASATSAMKKKDFIISSGLTIEEFKTIDVLDFAKEFKVYGVLIWNGKDKPNFRYV